MNLGHSTIPSSWVHIELDELLAPLVDGRTLHQGWSPQCERGPSESEDSWGVLMTTAIQPGRFLPEYNKQLPDHMEPRPLIEVAEGDMLITCAGPRSRCGIACLVRSTRRRLMMSGKMYRFRFPQSAVSPEFVEAFLQSSDAHAQIDQMKTGGSESGLNLTHGRFRRLVLPLPPLTEQHRIVDEIEKQFPRLDAAIDALRAAQAKLKLYRASVLKAACEGKLASTEASLARAEGRDYESASVLLERIRTDGEGASSKERGLKADDATLDTHGLPELPEGWAWVALGALLVNGLQNGLYKHKSAYGRGTPIIRINDYQDYWLRPAEGLDRLEVSDAESGLYGLSVGDLVINRVNSMTHLGKCVVVPESHAGVVFESNMMRARIVDPADVRWISLYLRSADGRARLTADAKWAVNQASINQKDVCITPIPLPPVVEQRRIVAELERRLSGLDTAEQAVEANLRRADRLRQAILKRAFEGRLVPQDPNDEPASILLERIKAERASEAGDPMRRRTRAFTPRTVLE